VNKGNLGGDASSLGKDLVERRLEFCAYMAI